MNDTPFAQKVLAALILALVVIITVNVARASEPLSAALSWGAVTEYVDGTTIKTPVTYNVYRTDGTPVASGLTILSRVVTYPPGKNCWYVKALADGVKSLASGIACKGRPPGGVPNAPKDLNPAKPKDIEVQ